jgi:hypothetical protein
MRINSGKVRKNLGRIWTTPKRIFEAFLHSTNTKMHRHECNTHIEPIYLIQEIKQRFFSYNIFPVKKKCWKNFKILGKLLFNYSFYPHPEIGKFQGVTSSHNIACFRAQIFFELNPPCRWALPLHKLAHTFVVDPRHTRGVLHVQHCDVCVVPPCGPVVVAK